MRRTPLSVCLASLVSVATLAVVGVGTLSTTASAAPRPGRHPVAVCAAARAGEASCLAQRWVTATGSNVDPFAPGPDSAGVAGVAAAAGPSGKTPADIQSAYTLTGLSAGGRTVAIVDAYGYPNAERDLGVYRAQFGLPACTSANGCLTIVNQRGGSTLPAFDAGWAGEQALDLDAVSAACPSCAILLVQATSNSFGNLGKAVDTAATHPGVAAISNSYSGGNVPDSRFGHFYDHPGIAVTASTGDNGFQGPAYPASSQYVTAVGGTSLTKAASARGWAESAWNGSGSGCTRRNTAPAGQTKALTGCAGRAMADVSAVADPATGLAVYAPTSATASSWAQYGGTSLSAPIVAAVYTLSGHTAGYANTIPYAASAGLFDVTSGSNGTCATWCTAGVGWDGPTGLGTPNGTKAF